MTDQGQIHHQGGMDIRAQQKTFTGFLRFTKVAVVAILLFLVFLALANG